MWDRTILLEYHHSLTKPVGQSETLMIMYVFKGDKWPVMNGAVMAKSASGLWGFNAMSLWKDFHMIGLLRKWKQCGDIVEEQG